MRILLSNLLIALMLTPVAQAQTAPPMTLPQAVSIALEKSPSRKMAMAGVSESQARVELARSAFLPRAGFTESLTYGNDPVYAFGTRLRQGRFAQSDFALSRLNYPDAIGNFSSRLGGEWNVFDTFQNRFRLRGARSMAAAARQQLSRSDQELLLEVANAYYGLLLAKRQVEITEQALKTAQALVESSSSKVEAGTAVEADALSAKVLLATRQQESIRARGALEIARAQLETVLGTRLGPGQQLAEALEERDYPVPSLEQAETGAFEHRPDLQSMTSQIDAQRDRVKAAKSAFGPQLNVFASLQADNPSLARGGNSNWMAGAELRIELFARDRNATLAIEKAALARTDAAHQMAADKVRLEVRRAFYEYDAARQMLEVARGAVAQGDESLRIIRDRYDSGLTTVTELLRAEDAARASRMNYWQAVYAKSTSYAGLALATGELTPQSPVVTQ